MKRFLYIFLLISIVITIVLIPASKNVAHADLGSIGTAWNILTGSASGAVSGAIGDTVYDAIQRWLSILAYFALTVMAAFAGLMGTALDLSIKFGALDMKNNLPTPAIDGAWTVLRDVGNLVFIFMLLYIAIKTIFGLEGDDTKRMIRNVIIIGLLVNFSLFFTQTLIDISNVLSLAFYKLFVTNSDSFTTISQNFTQPLGIPSLYQGGIFGTTDTIAHILTVAIGGSIFLFILGLTFLQAAVLFMIRYIVLIFAMVLSALAFFAYVLPSTKPWFDKWWNLLSGQLFFAPIYMLMLWLVMYITRTANLSGRSLSNANSDSSLASVLGAWSGANSTVGAAASAGGAVDSVMVIVNFLIIIGLLIAASIISMSVASKSGGLVTKLANKVSPFIIPGMAMRHTIGKSAYNMANSDELKERAARGGWGGFVASRKLRAAKAVSQSTLDPLANSVGTAIGFKDVGKGGYEAYAKKVIADEKTYSGSFGKGDMFEHEDGRIVTGTSLKKQADAYAKEHAEAGDIDDFNKKSKEEYKRLSDALLTEESGFKKRTRKEIYARNVLRKGNLLQRTYSLVRHAPSIVFGEQTIDGAYKQTYSARYKASEDILGDVKKEGNKANLGKLKNDRAQTQNLLKAMGPLKDEMDTLVADLNRIKTLASTDPAYSQIPGLETRIASLKTTVDHPKTGFTALTDKLNSIEDDIEKAQESDKGKKGDDKKDDKDKDKPTT